MGSTKKWYTGQSSLDFVGLMDNHLEFIAAGAYQNAASMPYYGEGPDSNKDDQSDFRREFTSAHFGGQFHLLDQKLSAGYAVGGLLVHVVLAIRAAGRRRTSLQRGQHAGSGEAVELHHRNGVGYG